jgi:YHS domain-containing protein
MSQPTIPSMPTPSMQLPSMPLSSMPVPSTGSPSIRFASIQIESTHAPVRPVPAPGPIGLALVAAVVAWIALGAPILAAGDGAEAVMPSYSASGALLLPDGYREWILLGSSLGLSYSEAEPGHDMFHNTLMEPSAYRHYVETGEFREGTMLVLLLFEQGAAVTPGRHGTFAAENHGVEMAVKDTSRFEEGWAYYNFGSRNGLRAQTTALRPASCHACHVEHAKQDNVFVQFYPMLEEAAAAAAATRGAAAVAPPAATAPSGEAPESQAGRLALAGLDPVHLVEGREEMGKPEIVMVHEGFRYQFLSEPSRARFAADPEAFSIRNETCPVVAGAPIDPAVFTVHEGTVYAFATPECEADFESDPEFYLEPNRE